MVKEEDIKEGLLICFYETIEEHEDKVIHKAAGAYELQNNDASPICFRVEKVKKDGYVDCVSIERFFDKGIFGLYGLTVHKETLSSTAYEWKPDSGKEGTEGLNARWMPYYFGDELKRIHEEIKRDVIAISNKEKEFVSHPSHYTWLKELCGVEPIDICRHFDFSVGNALKYLMRKGKVDGDKTEREKRVEDLKKAVFYLQDEIRRLKDEEG